MLLSVIVPVYNGAHTIAKCLAAVREARTAECEIIVVDDASVDGTSEIARPLADQVVALAKNAGAAAARRRGAEAARGQILIFVDADVLVRPGTFRRVAEFFSANPRVDAVTGLLSTEHPNPNFFSQYKNLYMNFIFRNTPDEATFLYGSLFAIRDSVKPLMASRGRVGEDTAFGQTLVRAGHAVRLLKDLDVVHLKAYSAAGFIKNDFRIPYHWGRLFVRSGGWRLAGRGGTGFAHASRGQLASLVLVYLSVLIALVAPPAVLPLAAAWFAINLRFLRFLGRHRGFGFALASVPVTFCDHLIMATGAGVGAALSFLNGES